jgi:hypothetical protein
VLLRPEELSIDAPGHWLSVLVHLIESLSAPRAVSLERPCAPGPTSTSHSSAVGVPSTSSLPAAARDLI